MELNCKQPNQPLQPIGKKALTRRLAPCLGRSNEMMRASICFALLFTGAFLEACGNGGNGIDYGFIEESLLFAKGQLEKSIDSLDVTQFPENTLEDGSWATRTPGDGGWTYGFFPGCLWKMYEWSGEQGWKNNAESWTGQLDGEKDRTDNHDIGFIIMLSFGHGLRLARNQAYQDVILIAAQNLASRYNPTVGCIRSWDSWYTPSDYPVIIDNMMNLELLFWASKNGGKPEWYDMAASHAEKTRENHVRPDGSTFHVIGYDPATGEVEARLTHQGFSPDSTWARGQAWGTYGFTMAYRETNDRRFLETAQSLADYFVDHLPADSVPFWDFEDPAIPETEKDSSAAAIAASGLLELSCLLEKSSRRKYFDAAVSLLRGLSSDAYLARNAATSGILLHGVGNKPGGRQIDVSLIYGDYYYLEALLRLKEIVSR